MSQELGVLVCRGRNPRDGAEARVNTCHTYMGCLFNVFFDVVTHQTVQKILVGLEGRRVEGRGREDRCVCVIFCPGAGQSRGVELSRRIQGQEKQEFIEIRDQRSEQDWS